jgi:pilus assembly protein Flp/PilA
MRNFVTSFLRDDSGASAAEYALILAIIGSAIALAAIGLGGEVQEALVRAEGELAEANTAAGSSTGFAPD